MKQNRFRSQRDFEKYRLQLKTSFRERLFLSTIFWYLKVFVFLHLSLFLHKSQWFRIFYRLFLIFLNCDQDLVFSIVVRRFKKKRKKKEFHDFFRSLNISNNSFFYVDVWFSAIIFVFFLRRNVVTRTFDFLLVSFETSFFLKLSERKKKNEILVLICCSF
jgi:hypothetical protein